MKPIDLDQYCAYRLPCGLCRLTNTQCPKHQVETKPTFGITTTVTGTGEPNDKQR